MKAKTKIKIIAMLMAMIIGTLAANAQSARRSDAQKRTITTSKSTQARKPQAKSQNVQRQSQKPVSTTTRQNPKSNYGKANKTVHTGKTLVDPKRGNGYSNNVNHNNKLNKNNNTVTHYNKTRKAHHGHYYYPKTRVKIHVHPMTYRGSYRALYYPRYSDIVWSRSMHRHYVALYPRYTGWHYNYGYRIQTMSIFDARYNMGEIARVYGRVYATWYNQETDDLLLFFGGEYPNQVFTVVVPGKVARRYSWRPERYFLGEHVAVTGLITMFEGQAEMVLKRKSQIDVY